VGEAGGDTDGVVGDVVKGVVGKVVGGVVKGDVVNGFVVDVELGAVPPPLGFTRGENGSFPIRNPDGGGVRGVTGGEVVGAVGGGVVTPTEGPTEIGFSPFGRRNRK